MVLVKNLKFFHVLFLCKIDREKVFCNILDRKKVFFCYKNFDSKSRKIVICPKGLVHNRPFYRYGGHIELIRFKEYYRMPREHKHISFVFSSAFRDIFS